MPRDAWRASACCVAEERGRVYAACGFARDEEQGVRMLLTIPPRDRSI